jgi:hypothetical protein
LRKPEGVAKSGEVNPAHVTARIEDVEGEETPRKGRSPTSFSSLARGASVAGELGLRDLFRSDRRLLRKVEVRLGKDDEFDVRLQVMSLLTDTAPRGAKPRKIPLEEAICDPPEARSEPDGEGDAP